MQADNQGAGNWTFRTEKGPEPGQTVQPGGATGGPQTQQSSETSHPADSEHEVTWTASEFIAHHKDAGWYLAALFGFFVLSLLIYVFTKDVISIIAISVAFLLFLVISGKKPQQRLYKLNADGISIGEKFYPYSLFKSFAVLREGAIGSINFIPLKRFMPELAIYYAPEDEAKILNVLVNSLPNDQRAERATDRLMKRLRF